MDLSKLKNDKKLELCRKYTIGGAICLPFLWAVNFVWFFDDAFRKSPYEEQKQLRKYVIASGVGALVWIIALTVWIVMFQLHRTEWGELGDELSFLIPTGSP